MGSTAVPPKVLTDARATTAPFTSSSARQKLSRSGVGHMGLGQQLTSIRSVMTPLLPPLLLTLSGLKVNAVAYAAHSVSPLAVMTRLASGDSARVWFAAAAVHRWQAAHRPTTVLVQARPAWPAAGRLQTRPCGADRQRVERQQPDALRRVDTAEAQARRRRSLCQGHIATCRAGSTAGFRR